MRRFQGPDPGPTTARRFKLVNSEPGRFIPSTCQVIVDASAASTTPNLISVLDSPMRWISQDLCLPIPVTSASRVLLRTCDMVDSDCLELDTEMSLSLCRAPAQQSFVGLRALATSNVSAAAFASTSSAAISVPPSELPVVPSQPRAISSGVPSSSFPYRYTCDMARGMNILSQVKNDGAGLASAFKEHFPGCPYVPKTLYKHLKSYRSAIRYHILDKYVAYQQTSNGKWSKLVEEVKKKEKNPPFTIDLTGREPTVRRNSPPLIDVDVDVIGPSNTIMYDDSLPAHDFIRRMSFYRFEEDCLQDFSAFGAPNIQFTVFDDFVQGNKFRVHMATFGIGLPHLESVTLAVKKICLPDSWWVPWGSFGAAIWTEGARAYTCATLFQDFMLRARAVNILLPDIDVVPTSFISHLADAQPPDNKEWLGQPWHFGTPFSVHLLRLDDPVQSDVANILAAFSHYSYQATNHRSVYVDFQGIITLEGHWRVLDSCTHVLQPQTDNLRIQYGTDDDSDNETDNETDADRRARPFSVNNTAHFFGSQGEFGLSAFRRTHNCTALCGILQLNPL
ncbi:hypothetical protein C8R47DRAFT_173858 [Mycena vitilis]|nr:hypothetical protein C8R47DRAFT_173858 [Mycena vitilis]